MPERRMSACLPSGKGLVRIYCLAIPTLHIEGELLLILGGRADERAPAGVAVEREKAYQHSTKRLFNDPSPPARRSPVEGREELLLILGGRADERALASIEGSRRTVGAVAL
jgi:hypothetical protein